MIEEFEGENSVWADRADDVAIDMPEDPVSHYDELVEVAEKILKLADSVRPVVEVERAAVVSKERVLFIAESLFKFRRSRQNFLPAEILGEPSWDILLDLFIAALKGEERLVKQLCLAAQVPSTTALRYISKLEECGVIRRISDKIDRRRIYISLTKCGYKSMNNLVLSLNDFEV